MSRLGLKSLSPRSLIGRTALILLVPIVAIQLVVSYVFIQRLYENVTAQMTRSIAHEIRLIADRAGQGASRAEISALAEDLGIALLPAGTEVIGQRLSYDLSGKVVIGRLASEVPGIGAIDLASDDKAVTFALAAGGRDLALSFERNRVSASNPHQLLVLMVFVSIVATLISFLFLRNQVRPIRRLAEAASAFGRGRAVSYRPAGATEVRQAGTAFLDMRARIERHIEQRTLLLSGVSHDLKTPLTRMKLSLSMMPEGEDRAELERDVEEMQTMLDSFLDFARIDATEETQEISPRAVLDQARERWGRRGALEIGTVEGDAETPVPLRPVAVERALDNLISNALRYGARARLSLRIAPGALRFRVEDDGPGIDPGEREEAMRPFSRLDRSRNQDRGGGVGLGLSIVSDIARQHGGTLILGQSEALGGLQADLTFGR